MIQRRRLWMLVHVILFLTISGVAAQAAPGANDNHGKEWRQLTETVGLTPSQVAQVCPRNGISPCTGVAGGYDLTGWVWATDTQVITLFSYFEPDIVTSSSISGMQYFFTATPFLNFIRPTFSFTITYQSGQFAAGWTASTDSAGSPIAGSVSTGTTPVSVGGSFSLAPNSDPNNANFTGVFLWRDTGLNSTAPFAYDDMGLVPSPDGGTAIVSVLANDWYLGAQATTPTITLSPVSSNHPGVTLDLSDSSVDVAPGTQAGTYTLVYQICVPGSVTDCDTATAKVTVNPYVIDAVDDAGTQSPSTGGTAIANVLTNDKLGFRPATTANVTLSQVSSGNSDVTLDVSDGSVDIAQGTTPGTFALVYRICETAANPANCDKATATVYVKPNDILAVNDSVKASSKRGGTVIASVLANDWFANARATTAKVSISQVSLTPAVQGITLDTTDGSVDVVPRTKSGTYQLVYKICEIASPTNCSQATATIDLSGGL
jgi:hypothetical protein